ncbi:hypothetical protein niasHT_006080 [Heterodera trifolii]|uniref:Phytanoyl-CoA hydroxylase-interacting protein-like C-terminal domain-containing protein n=1 Tax=Heterodera trifolii TaxID=157864 RepID=A0ABD2MAJ9_9BILA
MLNTNSNSLSTICTDVGLVRLHNLPRYASVGDILHFLWSAVDFEPTEALICAFSAKNAIVRFKSQFLADEAVRFCSGRSIYGNIVTAHPSTVDELERVKSESNAFPPELKKQIAAKRDGLTEAAKGNCRATNEFPAFPGLLIDSDDDDFDMMELKMPDFFLRGRPPDLVDFDGDDSTGDSRPGTSSSVSDDACTAAGDRASINTTGSSMSISMTADESEAGSEDGTAGTEVLQTLQFFPPLPPPPPPLQHQPMKRKRSMGAAATTTYQHGQQMPPPPSALYDHTKWKRPRDDLVPLTPDGRSCAAAGAVAPSALVAVPPSRHVSRPPFRLPPSPNSLAIASSAAASIIPLPPLRPALPPWHAQNGAHIGHRPPHLQFHPFVFTTVVSARHILLQWQLPPHGAPFQVDNQSLTIACLPPQQQQQHKEHRQPPRVVELGRRTEHVFEVCAGRTYAVTLEGFDVPGIKVAHGAGQFRATFSPSEMQTLFEKAKKYCGEQMYPLAYWDDIYDSPGGLRIMRPYTKDENGHPGCPINGSIDGLFFSTLLRGKNLPKDSPFGDVQMVVSARKLLDFDTCNLYFADFYCNAASVDEPTQSSVLHYVTVVVCKHNSDTDNFCKMKKMISMDWFNNPFLKVHLMAGSPTATPQYLAVCRQFNQYKLDTLVEVYYTEPFSLFEAEEFNEMGTIGKGSSRKEGIPNNKHCTRCNIYEVRRCTVCSAAFPLYQGDMPTGRCPKCDPNSGRSQAEFA